LKNLGRKSIAPPGQTAAALPKQPTPLNHLAEVATRLTEAIEDGDSPYALSLADGLQHELAELIDQQEGRRS
jgi:hypothetical protein